MIGRAIGREIEMVSKTAARKKVALGTINASASRKSAEKVMRTKVQRQMNRPKHNFSSS